MPSRGTLNNENRQGERVEPAGPQFNPTWQPGHLSVGGSTPNFQHQAESQEVEQPVQGSGRQVRFPRAKIREQTRVNAGIFGQLFNTSRPVFAARPEFPFAPALSILAA